MHDTTDTDHSNTDSSTDHRDATGVDDRTAGDADTRPLPDGEEVPFAGVYPATTTPFAADGSVDHDRLRANARRLERAGVAGLVPVGSTGESATLTHDEHVAVVETVADAVSVPVVAGAGSNATHEAVSLSRRVVRAGADAVLSIAPYYNRPEPAGFRAHFEAVADAVDAPVVVYNVPSRTGRSLAADTVVELAAHPNVRGYKAASGDLGLVGEVIERTADREFAVLSGDDALSLPVLSLGGTGVISVAANVEPRRTVDLVSAARAGEYDRARRRHRELGPLFRALFAETNPVPVTAAMAIRGYGPGRVRSPLTPATDGTRARLRAVLEDLADPEWDAPAGDREGPDGADGGADDVGDGGTESEGPGADDDADADAGGDTGVVDAREAVLGPTDGIGADADPTTDPAVEGGERR